MRKVFIPFNLFNNIGGPATFMGNLKAELDNKGFKYQSKPLFAKSIFFPISVSLKHIKIVKLFGGKIIQRLDGVYYPEKNGQQYAQKNNSMQNIYQNYADYVIFQSQYSKNAVFQMFGEKPEGSYSIIFNGVNTDIFKPVDSKKIHNKISFITTGSFRGGDMLDPILYALDKLYETNKSIEFKIIGPLNVVNKDEVLSKAYVKNMICTNQYDLAKQLNKSDIFLFTQLNPACSNSVLEAIACGLPVVGMNTGSMAELCHFNSELLAYVSDDVFKKYANYNNDLLLEKIKLVVKNFDKFKQISLKHSKDYCMSECAKKYIEVFNNV